MKMMSRLAAAAAALLLAAGAARAETSVPQEIDSTAGRIVVYGSRAGPPDGAGAGVSVPQTSLDSRS